MFTLNITKVDLPIEAPKQIFIVDITKIRNPPYFLTIVNDFHHEKIIFLTNVLERYSLVLLLNSSLYAIGSA